MEWLGRGKGPALPHRTRGRRRVVAIQSDPHGGHKLGLCNPETVLLRVDDDGDAEDVPITDLVQLTRTQGRIWDLYQEHIDKAIKFAAGDEVLLFQVGDATAGRKHPEGNMPLEVGDQLEIAWWNLQPWLAHDTVRKIRLFTGTPAHVMFGEISSEAWLAARLRRKGRDSKALYHARVRVDGQVFDLAHHGPSKGSREWLEGNVARYYLRDRMWKDRKLGLEPANWYVRGHYHIWCWETIREQWQGGQHESNIVVVPSLSGLTDFARKVTKSVPELVNGMVLWEIVDGAVREMVPLLETTDLRTTEVL